ncbi:MAG: hypothetical protein ABSE40_19950 [Candidatus Sulfotelmatobacter sp.]
MNAARALAVGVHDHAGCGLHNVGEIIAGIWHFGNLLLVHGRGSIAIFGLNERRFVSYRDFTARFRNF